MYRRLSRRVSLDREVQCHINDEANWVFLYDLSAGGAMIELANARVEVGDHVSLNLFDFATIVGRIAWKSDRNAGVRFDSLLDDATIEHLGFSSTALEFDERSPRDRSGQSIEELSQASGQFDENPQQANPDVRSDDRIETAGLQEDRRAQNREGDPRRRVDRWMIDTSATLCSLMRDGVEGRLIDLSAGGCSFFDRTNTFKSGHEVWLKIGSLEPWKGTVRWVVMERVGIEFERALHPAIFEHLAKSNPVTVRSKAA